MGIERTPDSDTQSGHPTDIREFCRLIAAILRRQTSTALQKPVNRSLESYPQTHYKKPGGISMVIDIGLSRAMLEALERRAEENGDRFAIQSDRAIRLTVGGAYRIPSAEVERIRQPMQVGRGQG